jgi:hypothetical protein
VRRSEARGAIGARACSQGPCGAVSQEPPAWARRPQTQRPRGSLAGTCHRSRAAGRDRANPPATRHIASAHYARRRLAGAELAVAVRNRPATPVREHLWCGGLIAPRVGFRVFHAASFDGSCGRRSVSRRWRPQPSDRAVRHSLRVAEEITRLIFEFSRMARSSQRPR